MIMVVNCRAGTGRNGRAVRYVMGPVDGHGKPRPEPPVILKGNPDLTMELIKWASGVRAFRSLVVSWAPTDKPTEQEIMMVMRAYEVVFFPGMDVNRFAPLYVLHRCETPHIHVINPAIDLQTGYVFDPVAKQSGFKRVREAFQQVCNLVFGWADPNGLMVQLDGSVCLKPAGHGKEHAAKKHMGFNKAWFELERGLEFYLRWFRGRYKIQQEEVERWKNKLHSLKLEFVEILFLEQMSYKSSLDQSRQTVRTRNVSPVQVPHVPGRIDRERSVDVPKEKVNEQRLRDRAARSGANQRRQVPPARPTPVKERTSRDRGRRRRDDNDLDLGF